MNEDVRDDALLQAVGTAFSGLPPIPPHLSEFACSAIGWADLDAEVAQMTFDSGLERTAGLRSGRANERALTFSGAEVEIELMMMIDAAVGQINPAGGYRVVLETRTGDAETMTDARGRFRLPPIRLPARLVVRGPAGRVVTPWLTA